MPKWVICNCCKQSRSTSHLTFIRTSKHVAVRRRLLHNASCLEPKNKGEGTVFVFCTLPHLFSFFCAVFLFLITTPTSVRHLGQDNTAIKDNHCHSEKLALPSPSGCRRAISGEIRKEAGATPTSSGGNVNCIFKKSNPPSRYIVEPRARNPPRCSLLSDLL